MLRGNVNCQNSGEFQDLLSSLSGRNTLMKTRGITKSIRLDEDITRKIDQEARNNNTSLNSEINNILRKYVEWDILASKVGMVPIAKPVLSEILRIMTKEQVINLANNMAKNVIRETVHFMKGSLTLESFLSWLKARMEHCSNVNYIIGDSTTSREIKITFKHELGEKWSLYHNVCLQ